MIYCQSCGKQLHESARFCPHCGAQQALAPATPEAPPAMQSAAALPAGIKGWSWGAFWLSLGKFSSIMLTSTANHSMTARYVCKRVPMRLPKMVTEW